MNIEPILLQNYDKWSVYSKKIKQDLIKSVLNKIFDCVNVAPKNCIIQLSIVLESDQEVQKLNKEFRQKDKPTNVLSFPFYDIKPNQPLETYINNNQIYLGDVILGFETIEKEALERNKPFMDHFTHLIVHSALHLLGFDHEEEQDATIMENLEINILNQFNIPSPYII